jgi:hypothetical protein
MVERRSSSIRLVVRLLVASVLALGLAPSARAEVIYESATLGTPVSGGWTVNSDYWVGVRLTTTAPKKITSLGGHFFGLSGQILFIGLFPVDPVTNLPPAPPSTTDALAVANFAVGLPSADYTVPVSVVLPAGTWAIVAGSGQNGATGSGGAPDNNTAIGTPSFFRKVNAFWSNSVLSGSPRLAVNGFGDADGDGVFDDEDDCLSVANPDQFDTDGDGAGDACDLDDDGDAVADGADNCPLAWNAAQTDTDDDGEGDACDLDDDGDAVDDTSDNCPLVANADQADLDSDTQGDACEDDYDGDAVLNGVDNCTLVANPDQADADGDGLGSACDSDESSSGGCSCQAGGGSAVAGLLWLAAVMAPRRRRLRS